MNDTDTTRARKLVAQLKAAASDAEKTPIVQELSNIIAKAYKPEAEELVKRIEGDQFPTTQNNYGRYLSVVGGLKGIYRLAFVKALRTAGAGPGLESALKLT